MAISTSSPIPATDAPAYTDLAGLTALKRGAANKDPSAIREVARQFESLFTRMMLKSMRDAVGRDPMFGSSQQEMYQGMFDDQLSVQLSRGRGLGLADMLIRQLQRMGVAGAGEASPSPTSAGTAAIPGGHHSGASSGASAYATIQNATASQQSAPGTPEAQTAFIQDMWPHAQQAGEQLGVDPRNLIAQAALETNWGRSMPRDARGRSSNNLFGVKASADWAGSAVTAATQEYQSGTAANTTARFRAYGSAAQSFQDYVALLRNNPRYSSALNTGGDAAAFASGLHRGGYATDPDYVRKIGAVARNVASTLAQNSGVTDLKSASALPISSNTGTL